MKRFLPPIFLIAGAILCFYAGYVTGQRKPKYVITENPVVGTAAAPDRPKADAAEAADATGESTGMPDETDATLAADPAGPPVPAADTTNAAFEARAESQFITFTDTDGRTLTAEVIEAGPTSLQIRRQADSRILALPTDMLATEDRAFAAYLWERQQEEDRRNASDEAMLNQMFEEMGFE